MFPDQIPFTLITMLGTTISAVWGLAWWLSKQFSTTRELFFTRIEKLQELISTKLEYHEKHDDERFNQIMNDIWVLRVRAAAKDGDEIGSRERLK